MTKKIVLLGEKKKFEFVDKLKTEYILEWINKPADVCRECAYVVIMTHDELLSTEIKKVLLARGFDKKQILEYCYFEKDPAKSRMELFRQECCLNRYDTFWFGMSHSYGGLVEDMLKGKRVYKFSAPSMDIYYHYQLLVRLEEIYDIKRIKRIYFELPYYAFNYDVSKCPNIFVQRVNFFYYLQDYHHFAESQFGQQHIYMFEKMNELTDNCFYNKFANTKIEKTTDRKCFDTNKLKRKIYYLIIKKGIHQWNVDEIEAVEGLRPHVWYKNHADTLAENINIWNLIHKWQKEHAWIDVYVVVFPFCSYFINSHRGVINERRNEFMHNINLSPDAIIDMFDYYNNRPEYFSDECHLTEKGAYEFSKVLSKRLF